jgi:hypothetical protein
MKRQWLHDLAKIAAGLVAADFIVLWWLSTLPVLPRAFLGLGLSSEMLVPAMIVDIFVLLILIHYAWNIGQIPHMKERMYLVFAGAIFTVVTLAHLSRVLFTGDLSIWGWDVPIFLSWIGVAVAGYLAYTSFYFAGKIKR